jgi:hypothetical protein
VTERALFGRVATATIDTIEFKDLDFDFKIEKSAKPEPNTCELTVYNLNPEHQAQLEQLKPKEKKQAAKGIGCRIEAGYLSGTSQIWLGDLRTVQTTREGPDWVTRLSSGDGEKAWQNARLHVSFGPKTGLDTALRAIVKSLGLGEGNLSKVVAKLKQAGSSIYPAGVVVSGQASRQLLDFARSADLEVSIQDGSVQFIDRGKALAGESLKLSHATGLIESPTVDNEGIVTAKMLMIPDVRVGGVVVLDAERVKGNYKIQKAVWEGATYSDDWTIEIQGKRY